MEILLLEHANTAQPILRTASRKGPLVYQASTVTTWKKRGPYIRRIRPSNRKAAWHSSSPGRRGSTSRIRLQSGPCTWA
ncbi:MAG: hypothetical protein PHV34_22185 [Verrucomicrobiae bacterium]|nr:hypothetical protein [Verrucomicrobiae bacterium]